jgi:hypothetical protein
MKCLIIAAEKVRRLLQKSGSNLRKNADSISNPVKPEELIVISLGRLF